MMRAVKRWLHVAAQVALALLLYFGVHAYVQRGVASGAAPALAGRDLAGRSASVAEYRGRPLVVHFWATWCPVCKAEIGNVAALAQDHAMLTVASSSGDAAQIRAWCAERGLSLPVVVDEDGALARAWGVRAFPTSFFLNGEQRIRIAETGFTSSAGLRARAWVAGWL
jgi:peroxiredoxin